jgi:two-component system, NtrC family, sensor kinase
MPPRFSLTHHFTIASLIAFALVAITLIYFQIRQSGFFHHIQQKEIQLAQEMQDELIARVELTARQNLLDSQEHGQTNLARMFSNALWNSDFAPFMEQVRGVDFNHCRFLRDSAGGATMPPPGEGARACFAAQGDLIRAMPRFASLDAKVRAAMRGTSVFRIAVYDLQGVTVYSSEHARIGDDRSTSPGWLGAARDGRVISTLTHGERPSASQGGVESRDLIASYLPLKAPGSDSPVGVIKVETDITPFLRQIQATSLALRHTADNRQERAARKALDIREQVDQGARTQLVVLATLLAMLYLVLLAIVRRAQRLIEKQAQESDATKQRMAQTEKMTSLGRMVAGVAHQLNTPLAFSKSNVFMTIQALDNMVPAIESSARMLEKEVAGDPDATQPHDLDGLGIGSSLGQIPDELRTAQEMLGDVLMGMDQMHELVDNLRAFTRVDRTRTTQVDLNRTLSAVVCVARSVVSTKVRVAEAFQDVPLIDCNVSQLNQAFLNLIINAAQAIRGAGTVTVATSVEQGEVCVEVVDTGCGIPDRILPHIFDAYFTTKPADEGTGLGLAITKDVVDQHGGRIEVDTQEGVGTRFRVFLPLSARGTA